MERLLAILLLTYGVDCQGSANLNRIVGGSVVTIEQFPYMASIRCDGALHCGGAIISSTTVLTAGHCIDRLKKDYCNIVVGDTLSTGAGQPHEIAWFKAHPYFTPDLANDIAVIRIRDNFQYGDKVQPIQLSTEEVTDSQVLIVSGWGNTKAIAGTHAKADGRKAPVAPRPLKAATMPVVNQARCRQAYAETFPTAIKDTAFCAGYVYGGIDACQGDSGGPIAYNGKQVGIVSWGEGCADSRYPGVYTRVNRYLNWVNQMLSM